MGFTFRAFVFACLVFCSVVRAEDDHRLKPEATPQEPAKAAAPAPSWLDELTTALEPELESPISDVLRAQGITPNTAKIRQAIQAIVAKQVQEKTVETRDLLKTKSKALEEELSPMIQDILRAKLKGYPTIDGKLPDEAEAKLKAALLKAQAKVFGKDTEKELKAAAEQYVADGKPGPLHKSLAKYLLGAHGSDKAASLLLGAISAGSGPASGTTKDEQPLAPPKPAPLPAVDDNDKMKAATDSLEKLMDTVGASKLAGNPAQRKEVLAHFIGMSNADLSTPEGREAFAQFARGLRKLAKDREVPDEAFMKLMKAIYRNEPDKLDRIAQATGLEYPMLLPVLDEKQDSVKALLETLPLFMKNADAGKLAKDTKEVAAHLVGLAGSDIRTPMGKREFDQFARSLHAISKKRDVDDDDFMAFMGIAFEKEPAKLKRIGEAVGLPLAVGSEDRKMIKEAMKASGTEKLATTNKELRALRDNMAKLALTDISRAEGQLVFIAAAKAIFDDASGKGVGADKVLKMLQHGDFGKKMVGDRGKILEEFAK